MRNRTGRTVGAVFGGAAVLLLTLGGLGVPHSNADPPPSPGPCCWASDASQPMGLTIHADGGGGSCIPGLNCGRINPTRPPPATNPPRLPQSQ